MLIDWDFESRLIDRIALREASTRLAPREQRVLHRRYVYGDSLEDLGERERVSRTRISQIENRAISKLRDRFAERPYAKAKPLQTTRATPPPGFDRAAFLRHMQGLIGRREAWARELFARERASLDDLVESEQAASKPKLAAPPKPQPLPQPQSKQTWIAPTPWKPKQNVEPWFDLSKPLTLQHLRCIAQYTLGYFVAARRPLQTGTSHIGQMTTRVLCPRDADAVATAMQQVKTAIPDTARLSAALLGVPNDLLAVTLGCPFVALRLASIEEGKRVSIEVTWDE